MARTKCPRCGKDISSEFDFCPGCKFPLRELDMLSDHLSKYPVPFALTDEQRKTFCHASDRNTKPDKKGFLPGSGPGRFVLPAIILVLALLLVLFFAWKNEENKKTPKVTVQQSESAQKIGKKEKQTFLVTVENGTGGGEYVAGDKVTLTADEVENGYFFTGWAVEGDAIVDNPQKEQTILTVGSEDVAVKAIFETFSILKTGGELHDAFLELADSKIEYITKETGTDLVTTYGTEEKIKRFYRSDTAPSEGMETIDISEMGRNVQAWYDDTDGTIYWYADVETIRLNENSSGLFKEFTSLRDADLSGISTENVTDMSQMFCDCRSLTNLDLSNFNTENVTSMLSMFWGCSSLSSLDLSSFDTRSVIYMFGMFNECTNLIELDLSNFDTENVEKMDFMFNWCTSLESLNLDSFDTRNVRDMSGMFRGCVSLKSLDLGSFDTRNVTNMNYMFEICSSLTSLDLSSFNTGNVTNISWMFNGCRNLERLDLSGFNTDRIITMRDMFCGCSSLASLDLSSFDTRNVTNMEAMFCGCSSLTNLGLRSFDTGNVINMHDMFKGCRSLISLDLSSFDTKNVESMEDMFWGCNSLTDLKTESEEIHDEHLRRQVF